MTPEQAQLLERIEKTPLVSEEADPLFVRKLASQNGWRLHSAYRAIKEYRRFLFLAMTAGHPVSPSDAVDQVWHQHLLYTEEYWKRFCPEALGRPFHHCPSAGGDREQTKFNDWYIATLESYKRLFAEEPPVDFWPAPPRKRQIDSRVHRRVDLAESWVIQKPVLLQSDSWKGTVATAMLLVLLLFGTGCSTLGHHTPFNMEAPTFLGFFVMLLACCWSVSYLLRRTGRTPTISANDPIPELGTYQLAYLAGGVRRLTQVILAKLSARGAISIDEKTHEVCPAGSLSDEADALERVVFREISGQRLGELQETISPALEEFRSRLDELGLLVSASAQRRVILPAVIVASLPAVVGGIKLYVGMMQETLVEILIFPLLVALAVALGFCCKAFRSRKGDAVLARVRLDYGQEALRAELQGGLSGERAMILCVAIALFGADILASTPYDHLRTRLGPESSGGSCGGGCGGGGGACGGCGGCGGGCGG